ncbi:tRNA pseudouridine synthase A [Spiroplasma clarkii]|uniref:tRNA pseudouridine(38-40) synthase TruA n=1 Tax=Spiroplasma clarkii TaxID=2139 RepID=UPI000B552D76|nr:tRNA pseudouridine(38-40) synthase TruA [Spiroplasma clarkii]ARU91113.1 tRNA pseudouridine synthase A [Spiroplasma clarkii]
MNYYLFTIQYDGTDFCGWAKQTKQRTIQGEVETAISQVTRNAQFRVVGASKTDAGVHAVDQKAWVELEFSPNLPGFLNGLNSALPVGIKITKIEPIKPEFRVRNCQQKTYHYQINLDTPNVFENRYYLQPKFKFDQNKLNEALQLFVGTHDFFNFSGLKEFELAAINSIRIIDSIRLKEEQKN